MSISFTVRPPSAPHRPSPLANGSHRHGPPSRRMFEEHGEEDDEERSRSHRDRRRDERVDGFRNGRSHGEPKEAPMVIPSLPNRDWRQTVQRRTPSYRPESRQQNGEVITHERTGDQPQRSGLRYAVKSERDTIPSDVRDETTTNGESSTAVRAEPMTLEQQALAELLAGDQHTETEEERAQREMVIAMREGKDMTEDEAYKRDVNTLPEESTLEDYAAVPISAFGLAMVRGMGYDPKAASNPVIHEPKLRPQLLGLGATPMDPTIRPTHSKSKSVKDKQAERKAKTGRGFNAANLLVKQEREGSSSVTPSGSRLQSPNGSEKRRDRDDDSYDSGREVKRERSDDYRRDRDANGDGYRSRDSGVNGDGYRSRDRDRRRDADYETEEERAARKARERRDRDREYETEEERARRKERERRDRDRRDDRDRDRYRDDRDRR